MLNKIQKILKRKICWILWVWFRVQMLMSSKIHLKILILLRKGTTNLRKDYQNTVI